MTSSPTPITNPVNDICLDLTPDQELQAVPTTLTFNGHGKNKPERASLRLTNGSDRAVAYYVRAKWASQLKARNHYGIIEPMHSAHVQIFLQPNVPAMQNADNDDQQKLVVESLFAPAGCHSPKELFADSKLQSIWFKVPVIIPSPQSTA